MISGVPMLFGGAPVSASAADPYFSNVTLLMPMNGVNNGVAFAEVTGKTVSRMANAVTKTSTKKFGTASAYLGGGTDYLLLQDHPNWDMGSGAFTIEAWINIAAYQTYFPVVNQWTGYLNLAWALYVSSAGIPRIYIFVDGVEVGAVASSAIPLNTWTHLAAVRSGQILTLYVDGVSVASADVGVGSVNSSSAAVKVGELVGAYGNGYIDDLRITKGVARYTTTFTPPTTAHPTRGVSLLPSSVSLLLHGDGANNSTVFSDAAGHVLSAYGGVKISTTQSKFGGSSMYFDGAGDYLISGGLDEFDFLTDDYTIEGWIYPTVFSADKVIVARYNAWSANVGFYLAVRAGSPNTLIYRAGDTLPIVLNGNTALVANQWVHIAVSRVAGVTRMFVGGVAQTATHSGSVNIASNSVLGIGAGPVIFDENYSGYIDDLRITKGIGYYTTTFTPPTAPYPDF